MMEFWQGKINGLKHYCLYHRTEGSIPLLHPPPALAAATQHIWSKACSQRGMVTSVQPTPAKQQAGVAQDLSLKAWEQLPIFYTSTLWVPDCHFFNPSSPRLQLRNRSKQQTEALTTHFLLNIIITERQSSLAKFSKSLSLIKFW